MGDISICNKMIIEKNSTLTTGKWEISRMGINTYKLYEIDRDNLKNKMDTNIDKFPKTYFNLKA